MGCRCSERTDVLRRATAAIKRGDVKSAAAHVGFVGRTLVEDARSGDLKRAAQTRLAQLRNGRR